MSLGDALSHSALRFDEVLRVARLLRAAQILCLPGRASGTDVVHSRERPHGCHAERAVHVCEPATRAQAHSVPFMQIRSFWLTLAH